jgi:hypothetical protein
MSLDSVVFIVGIVIGSILVLSVTFVYVTKNKFGTGGTVLALIGVVLIGLFVFTKIKITIPGIAELEADVRDTQKAIQAIQAQKDAVESDLNEITSTLANPPATGFSAGQIHALQQRFISIRQANVKIGQSLELAQTKTNSANNRVARIKGLPR